MEAPLTEHRRNHDPSFFVIEKLEIRHCLDHDKVRKLHQKESNWTFRLGTMSPHGLNQHLDFACFLCSCIIFESVECF